MAKTGPENERLRRWRLLLGDQADGNDPIKLSDDDLQMDRVLELLYNPDKRGGLRANSPVVTRWLGDIRRYFPTSVVQVMQKDAIERLNLHQLLLEPELLTAVQPDVHLVATLLSLKNLISDQTKETARAVVRQLVQQLMERLRNPTQQAVQGSLNRASRKMRPRHSEIDWQTTIRRNLKHYQPAYKSIIPQTLVGYGRRQVGLRDIILCVDQSGSMASSVVYSSIFAAVLASITAVKTQMVVFDTAVVDLSDLLQDPVELLFGTQLGGGTNIGKALAYCQTLVKKPEDTILVLISDLFEGADWQNMMKRIVDMQQSGVQLIALVSLNDEGAPMYNRLLAGQLAALNIPTFACTPDLFPQVMADAINRKDLMSWSDHPHYQKEENGR